MADIGNGATLTLSGSTNSYSIVSINPGGQSIESIDVSHLGSTDKEYIPGGLIETPEGTATVLFSVGTDLPAPGTTHTVTVTFPLAPSQTTTNRATFVGTGFITMRSYPELVNDTVQEAEIGWKLDGGTGPTFTTVS